MFAVQEIKFLGDIITSKGINPDPSLLASVFDLPAPQNKQVVQRMLGVINYFSKYVPSLTQCALLRSILKHDVHF